ncbi:rRNA maturation RNase YbeY [Robertkochia aurantiaca]|uniref:rRNA maturation RNase YbeY n=1 Tax=Robertkochia aurantiaca TaxID=2873700 RepID=UPI001CCBF585|nr:rRNA maturation RNase YbeY [Robertkochia sp. 3YJGBD-33]
MVAFNYETDFELNNPHLYQSWVDQIIRSESHSTGEINYIFCDDNYLHEINLKFLNHDTLTDIISFDYTEGKLVSGDIFISVERVAENARIFNTTFEEELRRVMAHGILHYCGYPDKTEKEKEIMRNKENEKLDLFHVEH